MNLHYFLFLFFGTYFFYWAASLSLVLFNFPLKGIKFRIFILAIMKAIINGYLLYVLYNNKGLLLISLFLHMFFYWYVLRVKSYYALLITVITLVISVILEISVYLLIRQIPLSSVVHQQMDQIGIAVISGIFLQLITTIISKKGGGLASQVKNRAA